MPIRGSSFNNTSNGGAGALNLNDARSGVYGSVSFRSALFLESWELVTDLLKDSHSTMYLLKLYTQGELETN